MKIQEFIQNHLEKRLHQSPCLVVYDPERRYSRIVQNLAVQGCDVINGSASTIQGREQAMDAWRALAKSPENSKRLLVYLPIARPRTEETKQRNPYQIFAIGGAEFPQDDGDEFQALCHKASPEQVTEIDRLFAAGMPDFETINNLIDSTHSEWPKLRTLLKANSSSEILVAFLSPSEAECQTLTQDKAWVPEFREFVAATLGLKPKSKSEQWAVLTDELWRFVLFSEFVFDLPVPLPEELKDVPRADSRHRELVYSLCEALRTSQKHQQTYMDRAAKVAKELQLEARTKTIEQFGTRDTFAFEERTFLNVFVRAALAGKLDAARTVAESRKASIWVRQEDRQLLWTLAGQALQLLTGVEDAEEKFPSKRLNLAELANYYCETMRSVDSAHRNLERAVGDVYGDLDCLEALVETVRGRYLHFADRVQAGFIEAVRQEGWPISGRLRNRDVFDHFVAPWLQKRQKVAFFMIDALRYELAVELEAALSLESKSQLHVVCAQLPTITPVGMASLLPSAGKALKLVREAEKLMPYLGDQKVTDPTDRFDYLRSYYGDRVHLLELEELLSKKKLTLNDTLQLLVVRTTDIDSHGKATPADAHRIMPTLMKKIIAGLNKVKKLGFNGAVLATDHGFVLFHQHEAGNSVPKPSGDWLQVKNRCLLGSGSGDGSTIAFERESVGIPGDFQSYAVPRTFATYVNGKTYFHEGLSLQECLLPVLCLEFGKVETPSAAVTGWQLSYKGGNTDKITTRRPIIEVQLPQRALFLEGDEVRFLLEGYAKGNLVAQPASCPHLNPATNLIHMREGEVIRVPLKMEDDFSGTFEVRAIDPLTQVNYATLKLRTDYLE